MKDLYTVIESILDDDFAEKKGDEVRLKMIAKESSVYLANIIPPRWRKEPIRIPNLEAWVNNMKLMDSKVTFKYQKKPYEDMQYYAYQDNKPLFAMNITDCYFSDYKNTVYIYITKDFLDTSAGENFRKMLTFGKFKQKDVSGEFKIVMWKIM